MIQRFAVTNFKNLARVPQQEGQMLEFAPLNVLIGPNGCGKSSLLQAIDFLRAFFHSSVEVYLRDRGWDYHDLPNLRQTRKVLRWEVIASLDAGADGIGAGEYHYRVTLQPKKHLGIGEEFLRWRAPNNPEWQNLLVRKGRRYELLDRRSGQIAAFEAIGLPASVMTQLDHPSDAERFPEMLHFRRWVERFRSYLIWDPKVLRHPDRGKHDELGPSGEHLASLIGYLNDNQPKQFQHLVRRIRQLFPTVTDISVAGRGWGWRTIRLHEGNGREVVFNSQQMSDGVLRLLAITIMLYLHHVPSVLTLEEPENGVHPQLIRQVVQILREITQRKPPNRCQIFFTTHSPYVLDEFYDHPEQVYCMDRPGPLSGATITRLSENRQIRVARENFERSLGEAWTSGLLGATAGVHHL